MTDAQDHKEKMKAVQAEHRKKVSEAVDPGRGLVLINTGKGKGKSSAAFGVVIRALGWGQKVAVVQFIKGKWKTGERRFFEEHNLVTWHTMGEGFTWDTQDRDRDIAAATAAFGKARELMESGDYDLVVLDEINIALRYEYLSVDTVLDERHTEPGPGALAPYRAVIAECFSGPRMEDIVARLEAVEGAHRDWAQEVVADLRRRSPLSLKITHRHIRESRARDLRQTLMVDHRLAAHILEAGGDFYEGVRAALIDKDGAPRWSPARIEDVSEAMLDDYFASLGARELVLPTREDMQAARA